VKGPLDCLKIHQQTKFHRAIPQVGELAGNIRKIGHIHKKTHVKLPDFDLTKSADFEILGTPELGFGIQ